MSFLDKAKEAATKAAAQAQQAAEKAQGFAADHKEQMSGAIDKGGKAVNKGTKGRFAKQIGAVTEKAEEAVNKIEKK
ncbi:MAG TPA: antitoxin [Mycobacteriales bacterium]